MEPRPTQSLYDPELDILRRATPQTTRGTIEDHQRLIVNPFLGVLGWLFALPVIIRLALASQSPTVIALFGLIFMWIPVYLVQFHCLDCGTTGWLRGSRKHRCTAVMIRVQDRIIVRRFLALSVKHQIIGWFYFLVLAAVLTLIILRARH